MNTRPWSAAPPAIGIAGAPAPATALTDEHLAAAVAMGDEAAFGTLYDRYAGMVCALAFQITRDHGLAEEITQETFLRLWRHALTFATGRGRFQSWLLGVAHHLAIDQWRRRRSRPPRRTGPDDEAPVPEVPDEGANVEAEAWRNVSRALIQQALAQLPAPRRQVIALAYFGGLTHTEIAARLGYPIGTVKSRMRLGVEQLRGLLAADLAG